MEAKHRAPSAGNLSHSRLSSRSLSNIPSHYFPDAKEVPSSTKQSEPKKVGTEKKKITRKEVMPMRVKIIKNPNQEEEDEALFKTVYDKELKGK